MLPALVLNYFGQGAFLLGNESVVNAPFFLLVPSWAQLPMILLATVATVIASQSVITGAYSVASQAAQLGYLPRLGGVHLGVLHRADLCSLDQRRSDGDGADHRVRVPQFGGAGVRVRHGGDGTITITTVLFFFIARHRWHWPLWAVLIGGGTLVFIDLMFLAANLTKLVHGAWLPLLIGLVTFTVLITWQRGRVTVTAARDKGRGSLPDFVGEIVGHQPPYPRIPGTAVFLNRGVASAPLAMRANVNHNHVLHQQVIIMSIDTLPVPRVPDDERISVDDLGYHDDGIFAVSARFGYMERPNVPAALRLVDRRESMGRSISTPSRTSFPKVDLCAGPEPTMAAWRKRLFITTAHITADAAGIRLDSAGQTVIIGARIEV